jgi:hypothetical protein
MLTEQSRIGRPLQICPELTQRILELTCANVRISNPAVAYCSPDLLNCEQLKRILKKAIVADVTVSIRSPHYTNPQNHRLANGEKHGPTSISEELIPIGIVERKSLDVAQFEGNGALKMSDRSRVLWGGGGKSQINSADQRTAG